MPSYLPVDGTDGDATSEHTLALDKIGLTGDEVEQTINVDVDKDVVTLTGTVASAAGNTEPASQFEAIWQTDGAICGPSEELYSLKIRVKAAQSLDDGVATAQLTISGTISDGAPSIDTRDTFAFDGNSSAKSNPSFKIVIDPVLSPSTVDTGSNLQHGELAYIDYVMDFHDNAFLGSVHVATGDINASLVRPHDFDLV